MRRVLLIRQMEEALPLAKLLELKGVESCLYPFFKPHFLSFPPLKNPQALIITSKNALRALEGREDVKNLPLYVVGDQTAYLAKNMGFSHVLSASGTSQELTHLILHHAQREKGILWHLSGEIIKGNIVKTLQLKGFEAERRIIYHIEEIKDFPIPLLTDLQNQKISHVMFFSPHTTSIFVKLLKKNGLEEKTSHMTSLCLSQDIAKKALELKWKKSWICSPPMAQNMIEYFNEEK